MTTKSNLLDARVLDILACPAPHHAPLDLRDTELVCTECGLRFPIRDGIPVLLLSEALPAQSTPVTPNA